MRKGTFGSVRGAMGTYGEVNEGGRALFGEFREAHFVMKHLYKRDGWHKGFSIVSVAGYEKNRLECKLFDINCLPLEKI